MNKLGAVISVEWGDELHSITLTPRNWEKIKKGGPLTIRGKGFYDEGRFFWDYWEFGGGISGNLCVRYGSYPNDGSHDGEGYVGHLHDATIQEQVHRRRK